LAEISPGLPKEGRYFIDCDDSGHRYLIPAGKRAEWDAWHDLLSNSPDDERAWEAPDFAVRLGMSPNHLEFSLPRFSDESPALPADETAPPFNKEALKSRAIAVSDSPVRLKDGRVWYPIARNYHDGRQSWCLKKTPDGWEVDTWLV